MEVIDIKRDLDNQLGLDGDIYSESIGVVELTDDIEDTINYKPYQVKVRVLPRDINDNVEISTGIATIIVLNRVAKLAYNKVLMFIGIFSRDILNSYRVASIEHNHNMVTSITLRELAPHMPSEMIASMVQTNIKSIVDNTHNRLARLYNHTNVRYLTDEFSIYIDTRSVDAVLALFALNLPGYIPIQDISDYQHTDRSTIVITPTATTKAEYVADVCIHGDDLLTDTINMLSNHTPNMKLPSIIRDLMELDKNSSLYSIFNNMLYLKRNVFGDIVLLEELNGLKHKVMLPLESFFKQEISLYELAKDIPYQITDSKIPLFAYTKTYTLSTNDTTILEAIVNLAIVEAINSTVRYLTSIMIGDNILSFVVSKDNLDIEIIKQRNITMVIDDRYHEYENLLNSRLSTYLDINEYDFNIGRLS